MYACDAHVHLWTPDRAKFRAHPAHPLPHALSETSDAPALLSSMSTSGVHAALVVQPINYMFDHSYILAACAATSSTTPSLHPVALADLSGTSAAISESVRARVQRDGCVGIRVNPSLAPAPERSSAAIDAAVSAAARGGAPVALFLRAGGVPAGTGAGVDAIAALAQRHPDARLVVDHFAFCTPVRHDQQLRELLDIGRHIPNVYVKASAFFRVSDQPFPWSDLHATVVSLVEAFGAERVLYGTDFPFVTEACSYADAWDVLDRIPLSDEDREWVRGKAAAKLYNLPVK